jgi:hypothetical protein
MKFSDLSDEKKLFAFTRIDRHTSKVQAEVLASVDAAINYLFLANAGGAVAVLSFLATVNKHKDVAGPLAALGFFCLGLTLVGAVKAFRVHYFTKRSRVWTVNAEKFYADEIDWEQLNKAYAEAAAVKRWPYVVAYASFGCLVLGGATGFYLLCSAA